MPQAFVKFARAEDFGEPPSEPEALDRKWAEVVKDFGPAVGGPAALDALSRAQKWQLITLCDLQQKARREQEELDEAGLEGREGALPTLLRGGDDDDDALLHFVPSPTRWLDRLRDSNAGHLTLAQAGDLNLQLKGAPGKWLADFYAGGGLRALVEVRNVPGSLRKAWCYSVTSLSQMHSSRPASD